MKAVIDRFEGEYAVILIGEDKTRVNLPRKLLPAGAREGKVFDFTLELDQQGEQERKERVRKKLDRLKRKHGG
ncbi:MAG: DUF3006 domain-containing protein [Bacillota bacterium]